MSRYDNLPPEGYDLAGHLARKYGRRKVFVADGFCVWTSMRTDRPYLLRSLDVLDEIGVRIGHVGVSGSGHVKIRPGCSCKPSAEEATVAWESVQAARTQTRGSRKELR
jgi:hypothetical protein